MARIKENGRKFSKMFLFCAEGYVHIFFFENVVLSLSRREERGERISLCAAKGGRAAGGQQPLQRSVQGSVAIANSLNFRPHKSK
jgi:hypothetical protein